MALNQWQHDFLRRLLDLGGSVETLPFVNKDLSDLIGARHIRIGETVSGATVRYELTDIGRQAIEESLGRSQKRKPG